MSLKISYTPPPTGEKFMLDDSKMRVLMGPVGCISGDTRVITEFGPLPIEQIDRPMRVLSWNDQTGQFQLSWCGGAFPKGKDYLHRVTTQQGEFAAAGHHQMLCEGGGYRPVEFLGPGQCVLLCSADQQQKVLELSPRELLQDAPRSTQTAVSFLGYYAALARRRGRRLLQDEGIYQDSAPSPDDVQIQRALCDLLVHAREGSLPEQLLEHTHQDQFACQSQIDDFARRVERPRAAAELGGGVALFAHNEGKAPLPRRSLWTNVDHLPAIKSSVCSGAYLTSCTNGTINSIAREGVKRAYWDLQVLDTNNYVTEDGTIHHNSGKSVTCCFEIIRRASMQAPDARGIRRTRCIVVRQTARQLADTTIKTFTDWFPEGVFGEFRKTTKTYFFKFGDVECEIMFRALDDADDVKNLNSLEATFAWVNESRDIDEAIIDALSKRVGRFPSKKDGGPTWHGIFMDTNPPTMDTYHYYMMEHINPKDGISTYDNGWKVFKQPSGRSPYAENIENLPEGYYDPQGKSDEYIRVFIDGEYGLSSAGRPVYKYFKTDYHMAKQQLRHIQGSVRPIVVGLDCGLTPAALCGQLDPRGRALILAECVSFDMGMQRFVRTMLKPLLFEKFPGAPVLVVVDPAGMQRAQTDERSVVDIIKAEQLKVIPAKTNNITARINAVDDFLMRQVDGDPGFLVDPSCMRLKAAMMGGYRFKEKGEGIDKNDHSHVAEALQYLCLHLNSAYSGAAATGARTVQQVSFSGWT